MKSKIMTRFLNLLLSGFLLTLLLAAPALADVVTIVPDGVVGVGGWGGVTVGNLSDGAGGGGGGDGTFASITGALDTFTVSMSNDAAYSGATINSVTVKVRANVVGGAGGGERITFGSTAPVISTSGNNTLSDDPAVDNFQFALAGITTSGDVDALEISVNTDALGGGETARVFEVWVDVNYTPLAAQNELNACDACHTQPPTEEASRNGATGAVVGSHAAHNVYACTVCHPNNAVLNHRGGFGASGTEGQIDMLANIQGGTYSLGSAGFLQDNEDGTGLGDCSDVACHGGAATTTPQWGSGTLNCDGCHGAPPATNAHAAHYTAKAPYGWTNPDLTGATCTNCHPDNAAGHSDVTDGIVVVNAGLTPSGSSPAISCGNAPALGCHNGKATPNWNTTNIACMDCHNAGGTDPADPVTGLHDEVPTVSGVRHHPFDANFTDCVDCHTTSPSDNHWDGTFQNSAPTINFDAGATGFVDGTPATCASSCHNESGTSGPWARKWHENSDQTNGTECAGCHGDWVSGWNGGVTHRTDTGAGSVRATHNTGTNYECQDCHGLGKVDTNTGYTFQIGLTDWGGASNHGNGNITINDHADHTFGRNGGGLSGCAPCHNQYDGTDGAAGQHSFTTTGWNLDLIVGEKIDAGCDTCHGGGGEYWPKGGAYPDTAGEHQIHVTRLAAELGFALPGTDAQQKQMCDYCHNDLPAGGSGHNDNVAPANVGGFARIWDAAADGTASYTAGNQTCANQCHNGKTTAAGTFGWNDAGTSDCIMCHTAGGGEANEIINPTTGLHDVSPTISGQRHDQNLDASGCVVCHTTSPSSSHIDGTGQTSSPIITVAGSSGFSDGNPPTCNASCHSDGANWARKWHENSTQSNGTECAGCHGTFATGFNTGVVARHQTTTSGDADGDVEGNHDGTAGKKCTTCHVYDGTASYLGYTWASDHRDGQIEISDAVSFSPNAGDKVGCGLCHASADGTGDEQHEFLDSTVTTGWTRSLIAGPAASCTGCHNAHGTGSAGVGPDSPHSNNTAAGGGVYTCEGCHTSHSGGTVTIANQTFLGIHYDSAGHTGIQLGGTQTSGTTEAEICWNCHQSEGISEWGKTWGAYQTGTLTGGPNWVGATWNSANFSYKNAAIQSVHGTGKITAQDSYTYSDNVGDISCTYCHDVHDTGSLAGDPNNGVAPFLRGTWTSNPFKEDGAPLSGQAKSSDRGAVPRGIDSTAANDLGGWQIEQNNASFGNTTYAGAGGFAGICATCHSQGQLELDWSGHAGAVSGFSGGTGNNYLNPAARGHGDVAPTGQWDAGHMSYNQYVDTASGGRNGADWVGGLRNAREWKDGIAPADIDSLRTTGTNISYPAGAVTSILSGPNDAYQNNFHNFPCAKCHNPHASRLQRLMITNCLDVSHNTWDNSAAGNPSGWAGGHAATELAYSTTAQNCHRYTGGTGGVDSGWNNVTPW